MQNKKGKSSQEERPSFQPATRPLTEGPAWSRGMQPRKLGLPEPGSAGAQDAGGPSESVLNLGKELPAQLTSPLVPGASPALYLPYTSALCPQLIPPSGREDPQQEEQVLAGGEATGAGDGEQGTKGLRAGSVGVHGQNLHRGR